MTIEQNQPKKESDMNLAEILEHSKSMRANQQQANQQRVNQQQVNQQQVNQQQAVQYEEENSAAVDANQRQHKVVETPTKQNDNAVEMLEKKYNKMQKWTNDLSRKTKRTIQEVEELSKAGSIPEEVAKQLTKSLQSDDLDFTPDNLAQQHFKIWQETVPTLLEYDANNHYQKNIQGFEFLLKNGNQEEIEHIFYSLSDIDPVKNRKQLINAMLKIGGEFYDETLAPIMHAGGLTKYVAAAKTKQQASEKNNKQSIDNSEEDVISSSQNSKYLPSSTYKLSGASGKPTSMRQQPKREDEMDLREILAAGKERYGKPYRPRAR